MTYVTSINVASWLALPQSDCEYFSVLQVRFNPEVKVVLGFAFLFLGVWVTSGATQILLLILKSVITSDGT